ncbi:MAG: site-specific integrase [Clostridia bacterium]|nr:site-specific integrase [Clostridia bacterium]
MASTRKRIGKDGKISYLIRVSVGYENGKHIERTMTWKPEEGMTKWEIKKELEKRAIKFEDECLAEKPRLIPTFKDVGDEWFEEYAKLNLKITTLDKAYDHSARVYEEFGDTSIDKIGIKQIQLFVNSLAKPGANKKTGRALAPKTIKNYLGFISDILSYAVKMEMIHDNPCHKVTVPKGEQKEKQIYSQEEMVKLLYGLNKAPLRYKTFFYLLSFGGLRKSEMLGLEWRDVDFDKRIICVNRASNHTTRHGTYTDTTKTKGSRRSIKVNKAVIDLLIQLKNEQKEKAETYGSKWIPTDRIFTTEFGGVMGNAAPYDWLKKFCKKIEIPFYGIHSFRHFVASALINGGLDVTTVSRTLGHSNPTTTLNIYSHLFQKAQEKVAEVMDNVISFDVKTEDAKTHNK